MSEKIKRIKNIIANCLKSTRRGEVEKMILRVNYINGKYQIMCPKTGKPVALENCHTTIKANNEKRVNCEHYKYIPTKDYLEKRGLGEEFNPGYTPTHIVCGYDGPIHEDWEEWGLDPEWRIDHDIPEDERKRIIRESGSKAAILEKQETKNIKDNQKQDKNFGKIQMKMFAGDKQ